VAILSFNRRDALRVTLTKTLSELDYPADALDVLVVDNASTDGSADMVAAEFPSVRLMRLERNLGIPATNQAFAAAKGEWCLSIDDDCWVDGPALKLAVAAAEANRADLVSFEVRSGEADEYYFTEEHPTGLLEFWGCAALFGRRALERLGGYDPYIFIWGEEAEFTMRLLDAGMKHLYLPEVVAVHMKAPVGHRIILAQHHANLRYWTYSAVKMLAPWDAVRVTARLVMVILLDILARNPRTAKSLTTLTAGLIAGLRARDPIRPELSAIYRDNFVAFANPLRFLRTPAQRIGALSRARNRIDDASGRWDAFRRSRPQYYPDRTAALQL
jgi:GT2 family glycosyltransferase